MTSKRNAVNRREFIMSGALAGLATAMGDSILSVN
jgi:hypothetical protein